MAKDFLELGPTPSGESCEQSGPNFDPIKARIEMTAYADQLRREFKKYDGLIYFRTKSFPTGNGGYSEVVVWFDEQDEKSCAAAYDVDSNIPEWWDEEAKKFLTHHGYL